MSRGNRIVSCFCGTCFLLGAFHVPAPFVIMDALWLTFVIALHDD